MNVRATQNSAAPAAAPRTAAPMAPASTPGAPAAPPGVGPMPTRAGSLAGVQARRNSEFIRPGEYMLQVSKVREGTTRKGEPFFVVDAQVLESRDASQRSLPTAPNTSQGPNPQGTVVSVMVMLNRDGAARDVRGFLDGVLTAEELARLDDPSESGNFYPDGTAVSTSEQEYARCVGETQPLAGRYVQVSAENVKTKKGTDFTRVRWFRYVG